MLPSFFSPRPKSASNIIGMRGNESKAVQNLQEDHRFRTYNVKDLKMAKTYLPQDVIREFKQNFEASAKSPSTSKSRNFVRKLVATLESRRDQGSGHCIADEEFFTKCYRRPTAKSTLGFQEIEQKTDFFEDRYAPNIKNLSQSIGDDDEKKKNLDDFVPEGENDLKVDEFMKICSLRNLEDSNRNDIFSSKARHSRPTKNLPYIKEETFVDSKNFDFNQNFHQPNDIDFYFGPDKPINPPDIIYAESKNKKNFRRTGPLEEKRSFRNVLSSLMGFKSRKSALPKGKRNILNPKDSLGEEMRLFRRDMMPVLLKAARPYNNNSEENKKDETFSSLIAASRPKPQSSDRSASIHPIYRGKKTATNFLQTLDEENVDPQSGSSDGENYFKRLDMQKVILREKSPPLYQRPPAIVYDVPKSNKKIRPGLELKKDQEKFSNYGNSIVISENNLNRKSDYRRKNIVCGQRALYIRNQKLETQF